MIPKVEELLAKAESELDLASKATGFDALDIAMARKAIADSLRGLAELIVYANKVDFDEGK